MFQIIKKDFFIFNQKNKKGLINEIISNAKNYNNVHIFFKKKFVKYEVKKMINYSDIKQKKDLFQK